MKIKKFPEDFIVDEIYDLEQLSKKDEGKGDIYYYFVLRKKDYTQIRALEIIARIFNTSIKLIHFAGTKDKVGITTQIISVRGINDKTFENNLEYLNSKIEDLNLEFIGKFKSRLNLGDNLGNRFEIVARDLSDEEIESARKKVGLISKNGVLNLFDEQRFGYANNSHIVGKYVLKGEIEKAVYEILTSCPSNPSENIEKFVNLIKNNWDEICNQNLNLIDDIIDVAPRFMKNEVKMLKHLKCYKNDFSGAFRRIHKKLRTIYVNAYQSYIFNETIWELDRRGVLGDYKEIPMISYDTVLDGDVKEVVENFMKKDNISLNSFELPHMPELKAETVFRETIIEVEDLKISDIFDDDLNDGKKKVVVKFKLRKGAYATNVIKQLFNQ